MITTKPALSSLQPGDSTPPARPRPLWTRRLASLSRWLHIYLSMFSFAVVLFFAVTGLTLNHVDWFNGEERTTQARGSLDPQWVKPPDASVAKLEIVEYLRRKHRITGALHEFRVDDAQCAVSFKGPGYAADAFIDRTAGSYEITETRQGFFAILNDLHKGRDSGSAWALVIDLSAVLMTAVSLTGFVLIFFLYKRRSSGLVVFGIGIVILVAAWRLWVP